MKSIILAALTAAAFALPVQAATVTYSFTAAQGNVFPDDALTSLVDEVTAFPTISGQFTFDTTPFPGPNPFTIPDLVVYGPATITLDQVDMSKFPVREALSAVGDSDTIDTFNILTPFDPTLDRTITLSLLMADPTGTAFTSSAFPSSLSLKDFQSAFLIFAVSDNSIGGFEAAFYDLTDLRLVPLPATGMLLLAGLAGFGVARRRR